MKHEEKVATADFGERYQLRNFPIAREVERRGLGTALGNSGYTTLAQAELLADLVPLETDGLVLDVGCGCGWPGLHLAARYGCKLIGADLPLEGLVRAVDNGRDRAARSNWVCATARALPFEPEVFDAIVHADVLC